MVYTDEDNAGMNDPFLGPHNPTTYYSYAQMRAAQRGEIEREDDNAPKKACWNCKFFEDHKCTADWDIDGPEYYHPELPEGDPQNCCDLYEWNYRHYYDED